MSIPNITASKKINQSHLGGCVAKSVVIVTVGNETIDVFMANLKDPEWLREMRGKSNPEPAEPVTVHLHNLLGLSEEDRWTVLSFVASLGNNIEIRVGRDATAHKDLLSAVLSTVNGNMDVDHQIRCKMAALEAAVLIHPMGLEIACAHILTAFSEAGLKGLTPRELVREAKLIAENLGKNQPRSLEEVNKTVKSLLENAPVPDNIVIPAGWSLTEKGVTATGDDNGEAGHIPSPLVISGRLRDESQETESLRLSWFRDGKWQSVVVGREVAATSRSIVSLAANGFPVTSNNAMVVVQYISDFEMANLEWLPTSHVTSQLGWHRVNDEDFFLCGKILISNAGISESTGKLTGADEDHPSLQAVCFRGADAGDDQIADGFHSAGTYDGWKEAITPLAEFPYVRFAIYVSLSAPLLHILGVQGYVLDMASETTGGKTTALRVAASVWGNPDESTAEKAAALSTWNSTAVCRERTPTVLKNLPMISDDTKHARDGKDVASTIYAVTQGRGKGRGSVEGLARQLTSQTLLISSGEQPITSFTQDGGTRARVLGLWGPPFGERTEAHGKIVRKLVRQIKKHYGHAGPQFVLALIRGREHWPEWKKMYRARVRHYADMAGDDPLGGRRAEHLAAIWLTATLAHKFLDLPWEFQDPVEQVWPTLMADAQGADRVVAALKYAYEWATAHPERFFGRENVDRSEPHDGWAGYWPVAHKGRPWEFIGFIPQKLERILAEGKFDVEAIMRTWADRDWLVTTTEGSTVRRQKKVSLAGNSVWTVAVKRSALRDQLKIDL